jgi:hypothetical protein
MGGLQRISRVFYSALCWDCSTIFAQFRPNLLTKNRREACSMQQLPAYPNRGAHPNRFSEADALENTRAEMPPARNTSTRAASHRSDYVARRLSALRLPRREIGSRETESAQAAEWVLIPPTPTHTGPVTGAEVTMPLWELPATQREGLGSFILRFTTMPARAAIEEDLKIKTGEQTETALRSRDVAQSCGNRPRER